MILEIITFIASVAIVLSIFIKWLFKVKYENTETEEIFNSIKQAAKSINVVSSTLCAMLSGRNPNKTKMKYYNPKENIT